MDNASQSRVLYQLSYTPPETDFRRADDKKPGVLANIRADGLPDCSGLRQQVRRVGRSRMVKSCWRHAQHRWHVRMTASALRCCQVVDVDALWFTAIP
ncbi:MAG TPA: hypothetical protein VF472_21290 [Burkholderiaceae bacterium]